MCGIAGVINGQDCKNEIFEILSKMKHRGPDNIGVAENEYSSIGMCQLKIRSPKQIVDKIPFIISTDLNCVYNGEVYGNKFEFATDEVRFLFNNYSNKHSTDSMNVFAVQESNGISVYRDKFGIKPAFYKIDANCPSHISFASEIKALVSNKEKINMDAIYEIMCYGVPLQNKTIFENVFSIKPNSSIYFNKSGENECEDLCEYMSEENLSLKDAINETVKNCLVGNRKLGLALSGGVDSIIIANVLNELEVKNLEVISIHVQGTDDYIDDLSKLCMPEDGSWKTWSLSVVEFGPEDFVNVFEKSVKIFGSPSYMTSIPLYYVLAKKAHELNVVVLLTGEGADELFLGYQTYANITDETDYISDIIMTGKKRKYLETLIGRNNVDAALDRFLGEFPTKLDDISCLKKIENSISLGPLLLRTDHLLMAFSIEGRTPYLHGSIPKLAEKYNYNELVRDGVTKRPLYNLLKEINDKYEVMPKKAFRTPILDWFSDELFKWVQDTMNSYRQLFNDFFIDSTFIEFILSRVKSRDVNATNIIYMLLTIGACFNCEVDKNE